MLTRGIIRAIDEMSDDDLRHFVRQVVRHFGRAQDDDVETCREFLLATGETMNEMGLTDDPLGDD